MATALSSREEGELFFFRSPRWLSVAGFSECTIISELSCQEAKDLVLCCIRRTQHPLL